MATIPAARTVFAIASLGYLVGYLYAIGHLAPGAGGGGVEVVTNPFARFFQPSLGTFAFEPVAIVRVGPVSYLFSLNTVFGTGLAVLVGANVALSYLAWRQPAACGIGTRSAGLLAGIPGLLSGAACCGPLVLLVFGIQASGVLLSAFEFMVPIAAALLLGSLWLIARTVQPAAA